MEDRQTAGKDKIGYKGNKVVHKGLGRGTLMADNIEIAYNIVVEESCVVGRLACSGKRVIELSTQMGLKGF